MKRLNQMLMGWNRFNGFLLSAASNKGLGQQGGIPASIIYPRPLIDSYANNKWIKGTSGKNKGIRYQKRSVNTVGGNNQF